MILFVCTGNTCRSPLACALARSAGVDAQSAGISPLPGAPASAHTQTIARRYGVDLSGHRARQVDEALLREAEAVWVMTEDHQALLDMMFPQYARKTGVLWPPIPDPYGGGLPVYEKCAQRLLEAMRRAEIMPPEKRDA